MNSCITYLVPSDRQAVEQAACVLMEAFSEHYSQEYPDLASALVEVHKSLEAGRISRIALSQDGTVVGWIGGISGYDGKVWELHPLAVSPKFQGQGIGRALIADLEEQVRARGAWTLMLGTDDEDNQTSLSGIDLYPDPCEHIVRIRNLGRHPYEFYQKQGFVIVGLMPDANGFGKPDILMAKRVGRPG